MNSKGILTQRKIARYGWLPDLPDIQLVQNYHRIPMNTLRWKNWPTAENPYINGASWHLTYNLVLWNVQSA